MVLIRGNGNDVRASFERFPHFHSCAHAGLGQVGDEQIGAAGPVGVGDEGVARLLFVVMNAVWMQGPGINDVGLGELFLQGAGNFQAVMLAFYLVVCAGGLHDAGNENAQRGPISPGGGGKQAELVTCL